MAMLRKLSLTCISNSKNIINIQRKNIVGLYQQNRYYSMALPIENDSFTIGNSERSLKDLLSGMNRTIYNKYENITSSLKDIISNEVESANGINSIDVDDSNTNDIFTNGVVLSSTLKKRRMKMNKHKLKKRRKSLRLNTKISRG
jgi:hypothetical protein